MKWCAFFVTGMATGMAMVAVACTHIPAPAAREDVADAAPPSRDAGDGAVPRMACRAAPERGSTGLTAEVFAPRGKVLRARGEAPEAEGAEGLRYEAFLVGERAAFEVDRVVDVGTDLATCTVCFVASRGCSAAGSGCDAEYVPTAGRARVVRREAADGGRFWLDVGDLELVRVIGRDGLEVRDIDPDDCVAVPRVTFTGTSASVAPPTCAASDDVTCALLAR